MNKLGISMLVAVSLPAFSCGGHGQAQAGRDRPTIKAETRIVEPIRVRDHFQAPGTITAKTSTVLSFRSSGQILSIAVREGDRIRKGQFVAEIDDRESSAHLRRAEAFPAEAVMALEEAKRTLRAAEAALRAAETNRDLASATRKRYDVLRERGSLSPHEWDEVDARYKAAIQEAVRAMETMEAAKARREQIRARIQQAEADLDAARISVGYSRILSPIDGVVVSRHAEPGMLATPGMPIVGIEDEASYELEAAIEESRTGSVAVGQRVEIKIEALSAELKGRVIQIVPASEPPSRSYTVSVALEPASARTTGLRSGLFARAVFAAGDRQITVIPESAIVRRGQLEGVYIVQNGVALFRLVKAGRSYEEGLEILAGITAGTRIVVEPRRDVADGVEIVEKSP